MFTGIGSALVGGALSFLGGTAQNRAAASQSRQQMDFQERMRATQYQTAVADMRAAGLNPMLAYQQGGAGVPGGAQAQMGNPLGDAVTSAKQSAMIKSELDNIKADTETKKTLSAFQKAQHDLTRVNISLNPYQLRLLQSQDAQARTAAILQEEGANLSRLQQLKTVVDTEAQRHHATSAFWQSRISEEEYNRALRYGDSIVGRQGHTVEQIARRVADLFRRTPSGKPQRDASWRSLLGGNIRYRRQPE